MPTIDLSRVLVSNHATERWQERVGLPAHKLGPSLRRSVRPDRDLEQAIYHWLAHGKRTWRMPYLTNPLRVDHETGAVFVLKTYSRWRSDGAECWMLATVTSLELVRGHGRCTTTTDRANARM